MSFCDACVNKWKEAGRKLKKYRIFIGYKTREFSEQHFHQTNLGFGHKNSGEFFWSLIQKDKSNEFNLLVEKFGA